MWKMMNLFMFIDFESWINCKIVNGCHCFAYCWHLVLIWTEGFVLKNKT